MNFRSERVGKLIREQLAIMIARELEFPNALVTITEVEIDKKLDHAKVKVSVLPAKGAEGALKVLASRAGYLQHLLLKKVSIKPMPRIVFELDHGFENAAQVEKHLMEEEPEE